MEALEQRRRLLALVSLMPGAVEAASIPAGLAVVLAALVVAAQVLFPAHQETLGQLTLEAVLAAQEGLLSQAQMVARASLLLPTLTHSRH